MKRAMKKTFRLVSAFALLGAILACGAIEEEDDTPPPPPPNVQPPVVAQPNAPQPNVPQPMQPGQPNVAQPPSQPAVPFSLRTGFLPDPHVVRGQSGGPVSAGTFSPSCRGNVPSSPQHVVTFDTAFRNLRIMARAQGDSTLIVRMPDGSYRCADDDDGLNPVVSGSFEPGTYQIYVGSYHQGTQMPYVLGFTELSSVSAYDLPL